jgi:2-iminobutanoate/2-iminopropanoate deaminase
MSAQTFERQIVASEVLPAPRFRYSPVVAAGDFLFVSGMVALDPASGQLAGGGVRGETSQILANLGRLLVEQGWSAKQIVVARIFCSDFAAFAEVNAAWDEWFADVVPPARTSVGVSALPLGAKVEMEFQLYVGSGAAAAAQARGGRETNG